MKKTLILLIVMILALGLVFTGCSNDVVEENTAEDVAAVWTVTINDVAITDVDAAQLEVVSQTLQKQDKEGNLSDQECVGYTLADLLEYAEVGEITTLTVTASDGYAYELTADVALLPTTMLVIEQDGEAYGMPRLAIDGEGSKAWVKDVAAISAG